MLAKHGVRMKEIWNETVTKKFDSLWESTPARNVAADKKKGKGKSKAKVTTTAERKDEDQDMDDNEAEDVLEDDDANVDGKKTAPSTWKRLLRPDLTAAEKRSMLESLESFQKDMADAMLELSQRAEQVTAWVRPASWPPVSPTPPLTTSLLDS